MRWRGFLGLLFVAALLGLATLSSAAASRASGTIVFSANRVCNGCGGSDIYAVKPNGKGLHKLTRGLGARYPSISPGGSRIAFVRGNSLDVATIGRPGYRTIFSGRNRSAWESSWSPDGTWIVFAGLSGRFVTAGLYLIRPDGTGLHSIVTEATEGQWPRAPSWSADGRWIAYYDRPSSDIRLIRPNGTGLHSVPDTAGSFYPTWSPVGQLLAYYSGTSLVVIRSDGSGRHVVAQDVYVAGDVGSRFSPDGKSLIVMRFQQGQSLWIDALNGTRNRRLPLTGFAISGLDWSRPASRAPIPAVQRMAPLKPGAKISGSLSRKSFAAAEASSVTLAFSFSNEAHFSKTFSYAIERKSAGKWRTVRTVRRKGAFHGGPYYRTVSRLFAGKPLKAGQYRLRISSDANSVLLGFEIVAGEPLSNVVSIGAGGYHTCTALADGTVRCWGKNSHGQLGNGTFNGSSLAVEVEGISAAVSVSEGELHSCALISGGTVECWGNDENGQLGNGTRTNSVAPFGLATPVQVSGITTAVAIGAGWNHTCAVLSDGTVECWGANGSGQLGNGTTTNSSTPVQVAGITNAVAVSAGAADTCALLRDGTVSCWGATGMGASVADYSSIPVPVGGISNATAISAGGFTTCALLGTGSVDCWGSDAFGQLGDGGTTSSSTPVALKGVYGAAQISAGGFFGCALLGVGAIQCWGRNTEGQLGDGATATSVAGSPPILVKKISTADAVSAGLSHACALLSGGAVCWGSNSFGQLGDSEKVSSPIPVDVLARNG